MGLLIAALFFSGWIYRWAYYDYFQLDVNSLGFSFESFLIIPIQIFFGTPSASLRTICILVLSGLLIYVFLWLLRNLEQPVENKLEDHEFHQGVAVPRQRSWLARRFRAFVANNPLRLSSFRLLEAFINELVIILGTLIILFWYAQTRGIEDARRDVYHCTSVLPEVTLVAPVIETPLVRQFKAMDILPKTANMTDYGIIGDVALFRDLLGKTQNVAADARVWRLLQEGGGWIYIFQPLTPLNERNDRPPVIGLRTSLGKQTMILSPSTPGDECQAVK
ncbi:MAG: hypothetical protein ACKO7W_00920 [Elainella sp.]